MCFRFSKKLKGTWNITHKQVCDHQHNDGICQEAWSQSACLTWKLFQYKWSRPYCTVVHKLDQIYTMVWFPAKYPCNPRMVRKSSVLLFWMVMQVLYHFGKAHLTHDQFSACRWQMRSDVNLMSRTWMAHNSSSNYLKLSRQHLKLKNRRLLLRSSHSGTPVNPLRNSFTGFLVSFPDRMGGGSGNETFGTGTACMWWHS